MLLGDFMADKFVPTWYSKSIYDIDFDKLKSHNIKYILSDLDNTIVGYDIAIPNEIASNFIKQVKENEFELILISNNNFRRLNTFCSPCKLRFLSKAGKPGSKKLTKFLLDNKIDKEACVFIGDQLLTDMWCAKKAKVKCILVEPLQKKESIKTFFNRKIDRRLRKRYLMQGKLNSIMKED